MKVQQLILLVFGVSSATDVAAFIPVYPTFRTSVPNSGLHMAIDYNDPVVAAEFANVQPMDFDEVEAELRAKGIPVAATIT
jgi:hypothetical protein